MHISKGVSGHCFVLLKMDFEHFSQRKRNGNGAWSLEKMQVRKCSFARYKRIDLDRPPLKHA